MATIKGITIEIGGDTQPLQKALSGVNKETSALQKELNTINRLLKLDPTNTTLLAQKQQVLAQAIDSTSKKLETLTKAQKQAAAQLERGEIGEDQYRELERQVVSTRASLEKLQDQAMQMDYALEQAGNESQEAANKVNNFGRESQEAAAQSEGLSKKSAAAFAAITAGVTAAVAAITQITQKIIEAATAAAAYADDINTLSAQYRVSTESLQQFSYAAKLVDVSLETFGSSLSRLTRNIGNAQKGTADQVEAFDALGVSIYDTSGNLRDTEDVFYDVIDALGQMENETQADVYASRLFGRSFQDLNPLVQAGTDRLRELSAEAKGVGAVMSQDALNSLNGFQDSLDRMNSLTEVATRSFSAGMAPALDRVTQSINETLADPKTQQMLTDLGEAIGTIAEGFVNFAMGIVENGKTVVMVIGSIAAGFAAWKLTTLIPQIQSGLTGAIKSVGSGIKNLKTSLDSLSTASVVGIIATIIGLLGSLAAALRDSNEEINTISDDTNQLVDSTKETAAAFSDTQTEIAATAQIAKEYADEVVSLNDRIKQLEASEQDATAEKQLLAEAVEQLNQATGETTATIDENTGTLKENSAAIYESIEAMEQAARESAYLDYWRQLQEQQVQLEIQQRKNAIAISEEVGAWEVFTGSAAKARDAYFATEEAMKTNAAEMEALETVMSEQGLTVADLAGKHGELQVTVDGVTTSVQALTEAEALHLLRMQENGAALSETEAAQLEAYKASNAEQYKSLEELVKKESELYKKRIEIITNTNEAITLSDAVTLEQRIKNLDANAAAVEAYEKGMQTIRENAIAAGNESMLRYLETLGDYSQESMAIVSQLVTDYAEGGGMMANELADKYIDALDDRAGDMQAATFQTGSDAETAGGEGIASNPAMETEAETNMRNTVDSLRAIVNDEGNFLFLGMGVMNKMADGMRRAASNLYSVANSIVSQLKSILTVNISATATGSGAQIRGYATGGVVSHPSIVQVAEAEPEAIIPLSKMGSIVQAVLNNKAAPASSYGAPVYLQPHIEIYAQKLTDAEMRRATDFVSREFAKTIGGQLS